MALCLQGLLSTTSSIYFLFLFACVVGADDKTDLSPPLIDMSSENRSQTSSTQSDQKSKTLGKFESSTLHAIGVRPSISISNDLFCMDVLMRIIAQN